MNNKYFDLMPLKVLVVSLWGLYCMFGGMFLSKASTVGPFLFYILSVILTLVFLPAIGKLLEGKGCE